MGQFENVAWAVPRVGPLRGCQLPERDQRRLRQMAGSGVAGEPLGLHGHDQPSVRFPLASDDEIISETSQEASSLHPWPYLTLEPLIQDMMQEYIRQHR